MSTIFAFWMISMVFVLTPGLDWAYAIESGIQKKVIPSIGGLITGHALIVLMVSAGVGTLMTSNPHFIRWFTYAGGTYLAWIGFSLLRHPAKIHHTQTTSAHPHHGGAYLQGVGVSGMNPKVYLLLIALLPQFKDPASQLPVTTQFLLLGMVHILNCMVIYMLVGMGAQVLLSRNPKSVILFSKISGVIILLVAILTILGK